MTGRISIPELRTAVADGDKSIFDWYDGGAPVPEAVAALLDAVEAALPFTWAANPCACSGAGPDSLPGECRCQTTYRKQRERLTAALARFDFGDPA